MDEQISELLKSINDGRINGAKKKLAELLDVSATMVGLWCNKKTEPSADMLSKLSKIFNKSEKEIQKIFAIKDSKISNSFNTTIEADALRKQLELKDKEIELRDKELELKNKEIELLKKEMELKKKK